MKSFRALPIRQLALLAEALILGLGLIVLFPGAGSAPAQQANPRLLDKGMFLIAERSVLDPNFGESVVLLLDYNATGAMGLIVNRKTEIKLSELFPELKVRKARDDVVYVGGPVERTGILLLIRSDQEPKESKAVFEDIYVSASRGLLAELVAKGGAAAQFRSFAGYAGWAPGQLDAEVERGDWLIVPANANDVFSDAPEQLWRKLYDRGPLRFARAVFAGASSRP